MKTKLAVIGSLLAVAFMAFAGERFQYVRPLTCSATYVANALVNTPTTGVHLGENDRPDYVGVYVKFKPASATTAYSGTFLMKFSTSLDDSTYDIVGTVPFVLGTTSYQTANATTQMSTNFFIPWARYIRIEQVTNNFGINMTNVSVNLSITGDRMR